MTIEPRRRIRAPFILAGGLALSLWSGMIVALPLLLEPSRPVTLIAVGEAEARRAIESADVDIVGGSGRIYSVMGRSPGFVRQLYAAGGLIVVAASGGGCGFGISR